MRIASALDSAPALRTLVHAPGGVVSSPYAGVAKSPALTRIRLRDEVEAHPTRFPCCSLDFDLLRSATPRSPPRPLTPPHKTAPAHVPLSPPSYLLSSLRSRNISRSTVVLICSSSRSPPPPTSAPFLPSHCSLPLPSPSNITLAPLSPVIRKDVTYISGDSPLRAFPLLSTFYSLSPPPSSSLQCAPFLSFPFFIAPSVVRATLSSLRYAEDVPDPVLH
ncbi:hypothetical protein DFH06DRAFT_50699 [Mycena polygramma]|nr:hypothetical protein DFH06DRAFT_50699 [Mycena polygramma]